MKLIIDNSISIIGLDKNKIPDIKSDLTFANKAYETVQRFSKYSYTRVPPYLFYFEPITNGIKVPIGYKADIDYSQCEIEDHRYLPVCSNVPPFMLELRTTQREAAESFIERNKSIIPSGCIQMPTGKGKSILGLYLASYYKTKTLIVVHKDDLITGWKKDIELSFGGKVVPGMIKAKSRKVGDFITLATIQTLNKLSPEELEVLYSTFGFVIQDEMHHCPSSSFSLVNNFNCRYRLGLTATPERSDGLAHVMQLYFGDFCYKYKPPKNKEEDEDILPVKVLIKEDGLYVNPVCKKTAKGFVISSMDSPKSYVLKEDESRITDIPYSKRPRVVYQDLDDIVVRSLINRVCTDVVSEYDKGRSCIVFFSKKEHCRLYYEELKNYISEDHLGLYYGDNPNNDEVLKKASSIRKFVTLTTYAKATEGTNVKQWEVEFLVSSISNEKNVEQAVGRIRRTYSGKKINPVIVYDYRTPNVYTISSHGRIRDNRYRSLGFDVSGLKKKSLFSRGYNR